MNLNDKFGLRLVGKNKEDLKVISAYLQDSIVTLKNLAFLKKNRIFVMIVNRFMWEDVEKGVFRKNKRIKCAIKVGSKNINQNNKNKILECLAIKCNLLSDDTYDIKIFFSGGSVITIISETIDIILDDFGEPWNVKHVPTHKI